MAEYQVVRMKVGKTTFEVLCKPGAAMRFREKKVGWDSVMFADDVFTHAGRGERAKPADLQAAFGSTDMRVCCEQIVLKGDVALTAAERSEKAHQRRLEIVNYIQYIFLLISLAFPLPSSAPFSLTHKLGFSSFFLHSKYFVSDSL